MGFFFVGGGEGDPADATLIDAKWESIALVSVGDSAFPHDYFLFTAVRPPPSPLPSSHPP